jgi:hypothetical protein
MCSTSRTRRPQPHRRNRTGAARTPQWRAHHGGRGILVPESLWAKAVERRAGRRRRGDGARATAGPVATGGADARAGTAAGSEPAVEVGTGFVELDAGRLGLSPRTVIRLEGRDGERLEVELGAGMMADAASPDRLCGPAR